MIVVYVACALVVLAVVWYFVSRKKENWEVNPCDWANQISSGINKDILSPINSALDKMPPVMKQRLLKDQVKNTYACPSGTIPEGDKCRVPCENSIFSASDKTCETRVYPDDYNTLKQQLADVNATYTSSLGNLQTVQNTLNDQQAQVQTIQNTLNGVRKQIDDINNAISIRTSFLTQYSAIATDDAIRRQVQAEIDALPAQRNAVIKQTQENATNEINNITQFCKDDTTWPVQKQQLTEQLNALTTQLQLSQKQLSTIIQDLTTKYNQDISQATQLQTDKVNEQTKIMNTATQQITSLQAQIRDIDILVNSLSTPSSTVISPMSQIAQITVSNIAQLTQGNAISTILPVGSLLYVGGSFSTIGGISANNIAVYDTQSNKWSPLGSGTNGYVSGMVVDASNRLYVIGMFTSAGGVSCNRIAMWGGSTWNALRGGLQGQGGPGTITIYNGRVFVGGYFDNADNVSGTRAIAMWDGSRWNSVSGGILTNGVDILAGGADGLYVGGQFTNQSTLDGQNASGFVKWDGAGWRWMGTFYGGATSIWIRSSTEMYVGGRFTAINNMPVSRIALWDGTKWNALGNGVSDVVNVMYMDPTYLYVAGQFTDRLSRWDGTSWSSVGLSFSGQFDSIRTMVVLKNLMYIGGYFMGVNNTTSPYFAKVEYLTKPSADVQTQIQTQIQARDDLQKQVDNLQYTIQQAQQSIQVVRTYTTKYLSDRKVQYDADMTRLTTPVQTQIQSLQSQIQSLQNQISQPYSPGCTQRIQDVTTQQNATVAQITNDITTSISNRVKQLQDSIPDRLQNAVEQRVLLLQQIQQEDASLGQQGIDPTKLQSNLQSFQTLVSTLEVQLSTLTQTTIPATQSQIQNAQKRVTDLQEQMNIIQTKITNYDLSPTITKTPATYKDKVIASSHVDINIQLLPNSIVQNCNFEATDLKRKDADSFCSTPGYSYTQGACYPACPTGYNRFGVDCKQPCLSGYSQNAVGDCFVSNDVQNNRIPKQCPNGMYQSTDAGELSLCAKKAPLWRDIPKLGSWQCGKDETYSDCYRRTPVKTSWGSVGCTGGRPFRVQGYDDCYKSGGDCVPGCQYEAQVPFSERLLSEVGTCPSNFPYKYGAYCYANPFNGSSYTPDTKSSPGDLKYEQKCDTGYTLTGAKGAQWCTENCPGGTAVDFGAFATCFKVPKL